MDVPIKSKPRRGVYTMVIALIIALPVSIALTGFLVLQSVRLGLKWQIQTGDKQEPTLTIPNPIKEHVQAKKVDSAVKFTNDVLDEWLNGAKEGG